MPGDYCTAQDVKDYLEITGSQHDTVLADLATRASRWLDDTCQHAKGFNQETVTDEQLRGIIDNDGNLVFAVKKAVANSITALAWGTNPTNFTTLDKTYCWAEWGLKGSHVVKWLGGGLQYYRRYPIIVKVSYSGGYASVPEDLVHAAIIMAARAFKSRQAGFADVVGVAELGTLMFSKLAPAHVMLTIKNHKRTGHW